MNEYAKRQGKIISDFLLKKMAEGKAEVVMPKHYTVTQSVQSPDEIVQGELIYFFKGWRMALDFKLTGNIPAKELTEKLRGARF